MFYTSLSFLTVSFLVIGCASTVQNQFHHETAEASQPVSWFQETKDFHGAKLKVGYSEADLTPATPQWLAGYGVGRRSKGVRHPLRAQCLALEDYSGERLMIVSLDLLGILPDFVEKVRAQVKNWPHERILFCCSHTHSAPDTYGIWGNGLIAIPLFNGTDAKYTSRIQQDIALAIDAAASNLQQGKVRFAQGQITENGARGRKGNPPDPAMNIMQIAILHHRITLVNYAMHPDVLEGKYISPDFVYFMREHIETQVGGRAMFVNGAVGTSQPRSRPKVGNWRRAHEIGVSLAKDALEFLQNPIIPQQEELKIKVETAELPVFLQNQRFRLATQVGLLPQIVGKDGYGSTSIYHIRLGETTQILTAPGELFSERWEKTKEFMTGKIKMLFGLTNVGLGYLMSRKDFYSGHHEYHTTMSVGDNIGEELLAVYRSLLQED